MKQGVSSTNTDYEYRTPKQALDALLERYSAFEVSELLGIHRANISHYIRRYDRRKVPKIIQEALASKGLVEQRKRIRSQITWESEEQKEYFQKFIVERGFNSPTEYLRDIANQRIEWKHIYAGRDAIWKDV